jgi:MtrB/PioB family decaheme-associated outer membrane protein
LKRRLALLSIALATCHSQAADFSLAAARTDNIDRSKWKCKRCETARSVGTVGGSLGVVDSDNDHIVNRFGAQDGAFAALQAQGRQRIEDAGETSYQAVNLGMESGFGEARFQSGGLDSELGFAQLLSVESDTAQSPVVQQGERVYLGAQQSDVSLKREREKIDLALDYDYRLFGLAFNSFGDFRHENIEGNTSSSFNNVDLRPVNYAEPIDFSQQRVTVGTAISGANWHASLSYLGAFFENDQTGIYSLEDTALKSLAPENESHTLLGQGSYTLGNTRLTARYAQERLEQEEDYITGLGVPPGITHYNGDVDVAKGSLRLTSVISSGVRLAARYDYYDRENKSPEFSFDQTIIGAGSGNPRVNTLYDVTRERAALDSYWRITSALKLDAGYFGEFIERDRAARDKTDEHGLYSKLRFTSPWQHRLTAELRYSQRDGSRFDSNSTDNNDSRLRQYHLADRDRLSGELSFWIYASEALTIDISTRYRDDNYDDTEIGLTGRQSLSEDISASYALSEAIDLQFFAGKEWIEMDQDGSQQPADLAWSYSIEDTYAYAGAGIRWDGLIQNTLAIGADYLYSESDSETEVDPGLNYGDYYQWSHSVRVFAEYDWLEASSLRIDYRYEQHKDFNFADVSDESIGGLTTLGILGDRYNAHQLMLTVTYDLQ